MAEPGAAEQRIRTTVAPFPAPYLAAADRAPARQRGAASSRRFATLSFVLLAVLPTLVTAAYLFLVAPDQFHSDAAFSVRSEDGPSQAIGLLGAITQIGSAAGADADILYEYARSQQMVEAVDARVDLGRVWARESGDPVFSLAPGASVEDMVALWGRMVDVTLDGQAGLIAIRVRAFREDDAQAVARAIVTESALLVNRLSDKARTDAIRYATLDLSEAESALRALRTSLSEFRQRYRMIDPEADVEGRMGVVGSLEAELAEALVGRDTLLTYAEPTDLRVVKADRRIAALRDRIEAERSVISGGDGEAASAEVVGRYEALLTDLEFAQAAYTQALANAALARAEARRQARYLASHIEPTLAETALFPRRWLLTGLSGAVAVITWLVAMMLWYNVRDSR